MNTDDARMTFLRGPWFLFGLFVILTIAVYLPSLSGGYIFDDFTYFVESDDVHVTTLNLADWWRAAVSQCSINLLCRPMSSLTFAANYYFAGLDPFWAKATNVAIHLLNGFLLFTLLRELFRFASRFCGKAGESDLMGVCITGAWLLLPINLTAVAYVSQRMETLANLVALLGLIVYLRIRTQHIDDSRGTLKLFFCLAGFTAAGLTFKEDAALLPLYAFCVELSITGLKDRSGRIDRRVAWLYTAILAIPIAAGIAFLYPRITTGVSDYRSFTIAERVLTEFRVLVDYINWTLLPNLGKLTLYHDDIALSHNLFNPASTLVSLALLLALLGVGLGKRKSQPFFCLGVLWFFAGHSMTATVIPLEIAFEHRNYFPSIGLLLALGALLRVNAMQPVSRLVPAVAAIFIAFLAFVTFLRAEEWSSPLKLAYADAQKRPNSERAQYELGRTLVIASGSGASTKLIDEASQVLTSNAFKNDTGIASLQALIYVAASQGRPIDPAWWAAIQQKLRARAPSATDVGAIIFLYHCQRNGPCPQQITELLDTFIAGLERSNGNANLVSAYGEFAFTMLHDVALAEQMYRAAVASRPRLAVYRTNLIEFLVASGQLSKANAELTLLKTMNEFGSLDAVIAKLDKSMRAASPVGSKKEDVQD